MCGAYQRLEITSLPIGRDTHKIHFTQSGGKVSKLPPYRLVGIPLAIIGIGSLGAGLEITSLPIGRDTSLTLRH